MKIAVVGATGLVGQTILSLLEARRFPVEELIPVASARSAGREIVYEGKAYPVVTPEKAVSMGARLALFSAGGSLSLEWAEQFAAQGCYVVDNSSAWRMHPDKKLIVPEVNGQVLQQHDRVIANPNCSTIQMVMVLHPLHRQWGVRRVVVSTYQSVTGSGQKGIDQLQSERRGEFEARAAYPHPIDLNLIPHIDVFENNGYTKEEMKMVFETRKIMAAPSIEVAPTAVRVPVTGGHSESVSITMERPFSLEEIRAALRGQRGVVVADDPASNRYPMPLDAVGKDEVFVGRIRKDLFSDSTLHCWIVADNLRKGAATNAVQIAELLLKNGWLG